jgi:hypothetical protein
MCAGLTGSLRLPFCPYFPDFSDDFRPTGWQKKRERKNRIRAATRWKLRGTSFLKLWDEAKRGHETLTRSATRKG